jgi:hypothetical protein
MRPDPLSLLAVSIAALIAALLFLVAAVSDVTLGTALTRAITAWAVLSVLGIGVTVLIRWVLRVPAPGAKLDVIVRNE